MKKRLTALALFAYENFAPLIIFLVAEHLVGFRGAITVTIALSCADFLARVVMKHSPTRLYYLSFFTTLLFGLIDLLSANPFIFQYEAVFTNLLTAGFFGMTLFRGTPLIQEVAVKAMPPEKAARKEIRDYLRFLTLVWTLYFVVKSIVYYYFASRYPIDQAIALRSAVGTASLVVLLFGERLIRKPLFLFLKNRGVIGQPSHPAIPNV